MIPRTITMKPRKKVQAVWDPSKYFQYSIFWPQLLHTYISHNVGLLEVGVTWTVSSRENESEEHFLHQWLEGNPDDFAFLSSRRLIEFDIIIALESRLIKPETNTVFKVTIMESRSTIFCSWVLIIIGWYRTNIINKNIHGKLSDLYLKTENLY
jgi:hypothetical protein